VSYREKSAVVMLLVMGAVYGWYFGLVLARAASTPVTTIDYGPALVGAVVLLVILAVVAHIAVAAVSAGEGGADLADERDRSITLRGDRVGGYVLTVGVLAGIGVLLADVDGFWVAQVLLGGLVLSEMCKSVTMLVLYRRGV
jgi:hypothetical protein